jgi:nicotinate-nucleotide pyrophosphorylase (carboxylating)
MPVPAHVIEFIGRALAEDIGHGDVTTDSIIPPSRKAKASVIARQSTVIAGLDFFREVFRQVDPSVKIRLKVKDSDRVKHGATLCELNGPVHSILKAERVALNILQRLSGIATFTSGLVGKVRGYNVKIVDTRKTTPCMRYMEKYAVRMGGGHNHRFGLYDGILIKDNHIEVAGGIKKAVKKVKDAHHLLNVEVEVKNQKEVKEALDAGVEVIMLDNMTPAHMKKAVERIKMDNSDVLVEASGNVTAENIRDIAATGVDLISVGALTHSAPAADLSLKILK